MKSFLAVIALAAMLLASTAMAATATIRPDGQGAHSAWGNVNCVLDWQCVDETIANTTDYLRASGTEKETFSFANTGLTTETINSVTLYYYAMQNANNKNRCFSPMTRSGGVDYVLASQLCTNGLWATFSHTYTTNPATGVAWTVSEVEALEAGMQATNPDGGARIAQVYATMDYNPLMPDLVIDGLSFIEFNVNGTNTTYVNVTTTVKNIGTLTAGNSTTRLTVVSGSWNQFTPTLTAGSTYVFTKTYQCTAAHDATATADYFGVVTESNEANNALNTYIDCVL